MEVHTHLRGVVAPEAGMGHPAVTAVVLVVRFLVAVEVPAVVFQAAAEAVAVTPVRADLPVRQAEVVFLVAADLLAHLVEAHQAEVVFPAAAEAGSLEENKQLLLKDDSVIAAVFFVM